MCFLHQPHVLYSQCPRVVKNETPASPALRGRAGEWGEPSGELTLEKTWTEWGRWWAERAGSLGCWWQNNSEKWSKRKVSFLNVLKKSYHLVKIPHQALLCSGANIQPLGRLPSLGRVSKGSWPSLVFSPPSAAVAGAWAAVGICWPASSRPPPGLWQCQP